ncbi:hypothetical protein TL16_g10247 [Triparma laevis f. inornata]|uniref:Uncharacterized protein n=1 Tax=Triparma laevis f. inornata TaxID=1714386 RepID=A0A9W7ELT6_9STRA|nr:hypothetical protein TL16_g10247 [Triparma laevis f. inornata]
MTSADVIFANNFNGVYGPGLKTKGRCLDDHVLSVLAQSKAGKKLKSDNFNVGKWLFDVGSDDLAKIKQILVNHGGKDPENPQPIAKRPRPAADEVPHVVPNPLRESSPPPGTEAPAPAPTIIQREAPPVIHRVIASNESEEEEEESQQEEESNGEVSI